MTALQTKPTLMPAGSEVSGTATSKKRHYWIGAAMLALFAAGAGVWTFIWPGASSGNVTFVRVSTGRPMDLYTRNFNRLAPAGPVLWHLQGVLHKIGLESAAEHLVNRKTVFDADTDRVCAVIGVNGGFPDFKELGAVAVTGHGVIPLQFEGQSTESGTERHLVWLKSAPRSYVPNWGVLLVTNIQSGKTLISYKY